MNEFLSWDTVEIKGIYLTRYIASWYNAGGESDYRKIVNWASSLIINGERLTDAEIRCIADRATNGMLQLEEWAKKYI